MAKKRTSKWSKSELTKLRESLPSNWKETLSEEHKLSIGTIENIIYGASVKDEVILSAIELAKAYKSQIIASKEAINAL